MRRAILFSLPIYLCAFSLFSAARPDPVPASLGAGLTEYRLTRNSVEERGLDAAIDPAGKPHLVYERNGKIYYWHFLNPEELVDYGSKPAIALDTHGIPRLVYIDGGTVKYTSREGGAWSSPIVVSAGTEADIAMDPLNNAHLVYINPTYNLVEGWGKNEILYATNRSGSFVSRLLFSPQYHYPVYSDYFSPHIAIDTQGKYHIVCREDGRVFYSGSATYGTYIVYLTNKSGNDILNYLTGVGDWQTYNLNKNPIAIDSADNVHLIYENSTSVYSAKVNPGSYLDPSLLGTGSQAAIAARGTEIAVAFRDLTGSVLFARNSGSGFGTPEVLDAGSEPVVLLGSLHVCYLKSAEGQNDVFDRTDAAPELKVNSPDGGEHWLPGSTRPVTWMTAESVASVKIEYSADAGSSWSTISASEANSRTYSWTVPNISSTACLVRVSDASTGTPMDVSDAAFSIDAETGAITGRGTNASGSPVEDVGVGIYGPSGNLVTSAHTDSGGSYSVLGLAAGNYRIYFDTSLARDYLGEWYNDKAGSGAADAVSVTAGSTAAGIDAQLATGGSITGRVTNALAEGVGGIDVCVYDGSGNMVVKANTDSSGNYTVHPLAAGGYKIYFNTRYVTSYYSEWYNDKASSGTADTVSVTAGSATAGIDAQLTALGSIEGKVRNASGEGIELVKISIYDLSKKLVKEGLTDRRGDYTVYFQVSGGYKVYFDTSDAKDYLGEWYDDKSDFAAANIVTVTAGSTVWNTDAQLAPMPLVMISLDKSGLFFGAVKDSVSTAAQSLVVSNAGVGTMSWTAAGSPSWVKVSPASGTGTAALSVRVNPSGLGPGTYKGKVTIKATGAPNSPQTVSVTLKVYGKGKTAVPFGSFDTPAGGSTVMGSIPVSGWALDDIEVTKVEVRRDPVGADPPAAIGPDGLVYLGEATFIDGSRPDVETAWPSYPLNYRAGWGYMLLTYGLPAQGNGTFVLHAVASDKDGHSTDLGTKTIVSDNAHNTMPFGAIDTPGQGGTVSGSSYVNFGWVLTPLPAMVPIDGSTIWLWIDGVQVGHPTYNNYRADIHDAYPDHLNADGAVGFYYINTTAYTDGMHTIGWSATDDHGQEGGIGSRFFRVLNTGSGALASTLNALTASGQTDTKGLAPGVALDVSPSTGFGSLASGPASSASSSTCLGRMADLAGMASDIMSPVYVRTGFMDDGPHEAVAPDALAIRAINVEEAGRVVISLESASGLPGLGRGRYQEPRADRASPEAIGGPSRWSGYLVVNNELRPLPIGSTFDARNGVLYWQPGPGFLGEYRFVFVNGGNGTKKLISLKVRPKSLPPGS